MKDQGQDSGTGLHTTNLHTRGVELQRLRAVDFRLEEEVQLEVRLCVRRESESTTSIFRKFKNPKHKHLGTLGIPFLLSLF